MVQSNGSNVYVAVNGVFQTLTGGNFAPAGGSGTIAPSGPASTPTASVNAPITVGQANTQAGPNFAIAKARLVFGNDTSAASKAAANVYSSGNFTSTLSPNFNQTLPSGATVAWSLDTQYPLPTYPSIQDVTPIALQASAYGAVPTPIGGVTSNVLSPYSTTYPQLDSIRFDGTGYIDYGNAASSVLTTNLWANAWTIEGWVYLNSYPNTPVFVREPYTTNSGSDFAVGLNSSGVPYINSNGGVLIIAGTAIPLSTWTHLAITYDGAKSNIYQGTSGTSSTVASATPSGSNMIYTPTSNFRIGGSVSAGQIVGNLADLRVSNVARYTGSTYTVPTAPFATDSSTLLLLKSLGGQPGTTLEVQGRGLNSTSIGAGRVVQSYPPAPMSSYLLDTTSNALVTYGQGKYVASASSEYNTSGSYSAWIAFDKRSQTAGGNPLGYEWASATNYSSGAYTGSVITVDTLGNSYAGEWLQFQSPVSVVLGTYSITASSDAGSYQSPSTFYVLGSRDGINWTLVDSRAGVSGWGNSVTQTFTASSTQAYTYFRIIANKTSGSGAVPTFTIMELIFNGTEESLCITSDSKVGVGIANPQRALEVAGDLVVSGTISGGAGMGAFRNRIINGDMRIAQRGVGPSTIAASTNAVLDIDRWNSVYVTSGTFTTGQSAVVPLGQGFSNSFVQTMTVATTSNDYGTSRQYIEGYNMYDLSWGTSYGQPVTLSFWTMITNVPAGSILPVAVVYSGSSATYYYLSSYTVSGPSAWQYVTITVPPPPSAAGSFTAALNTTHTYVSFPLTSFGASSPAQPNTWVSAVSTNKFRVWGTYDLASTVGWSRYITGVQLERGTVATPFEVRPYATELQLCQRYYWNFSSAGGVYTGFGSGYTNGTSALIMVPFPVQMRAQPTQNSNSAMTTFVVLSTGASVSPSALSTFTTGLNSSILTFTVAGQTAGQGAILQANNTTGAFVAFSAEL
jgi:hypothetical protein